MKQQLLVTVLAMSNLLQTPGQTSNPHKVGVEKALAQHRQRIDVLDKQIVSLLKRELGSPWKSAAFGTGREYRRHLPAVVRTKSCATQWPIALPH